MNRTSAKRSVAIAGMLTACALLPGCGARGATTADSTAGGLKTGPGFDGKQFTVGVITVTSGPLASSFSDSSAGIEAYAADLNARGGIAGKYPVKIVTRDHGLDPAKAVQAYQATKNDVALYAWLTGTGIVNAVLPQLKSDNILAFVASGNGKFVYEPNTLSITVPSETLQLNGVDYLMKKRGKDQTFCSLGTEGELANGVAATLEYAKAHLGAKTGPSVAVPATGDPTPQIQQLRRANCDVVLLNALIIPVASTALSTAAQLGYEPTWLGNSSSWGPVLNSGPLYDYTVKNMLVVNDGLPWSDTSAEMATVVASQQKNAPKANPGIQFLWGYNNMAILEQVLTKAVETGDVSRPGIKAASESLTTLDTPTQFDRSWGKPNERGIPDKFCLLAPDNTAAGGTKAVECGIDAAEAALTYPYPKAG